MSYVIAIDYETSGGIPLKHGFTQLGAVLYDVKNEKICETFNEYASMKGYEWEERCLREFWLRADMRELYQHTLRMTNASTFTPYQVVDHFMEWAKRVTKDIDDVYLISDNVAFDVAILRTFSTDQDILYMFKGKYHEMVDVSSFYAGMRRARVNAKILDEVASADMALEGLNGRPGMTGHVELPEFPKLHGNEHDAIADAVLIAQRWAWFQNQLTQF